MVTTRLVVAPQTVRCWGLWAEQDCLSVWFPSQTTPHTMSQGIEGFTFEPGFVQELLVEVTPNDPHVMDGYSHTYRLKRVIRKMPEGVIVDHRD